MALAATPSISLDNKLAGSTDGPISEKDWTGLYTITILVVKTKIEAARNALPQDLVLDESYGQDGSYPILMSCGSIQNARPRLGGAIGFNYLEVFSAIPGVRLRNPNGGFPGPFLHPYTGYLNHLIPVALGRAAGIRKYWERLSVSRKAHLITSDGFRVQGLLSGRPLLSGQFSVSTKVEAATENRRVVSLAKLLPPNLIGVGLLGKLVQTKFQFFYSLGTAEDVVDASVDIKTNNFIPGISGPISYASMAEFQWDPRYLPVRLFVPWRLREKDGQCGTKAAAVEPAKARAAGAD